jgi:hypothetical protein
MASNLGSEIAQLRTGQMSQKMLTGPFLGGAAPELAAVCRAVTVPADADLDAMVEWDQENGPRDLRRAFRALRRAR